MTIYFFFCTDAVHSTADWVNIGQKLEPFQALSNLLISTCKVYRSLIREPTLCTSAALDIIKCKMQIDLCKTNSHDLFAIALNIIIVYSRHMTFLWSEDILFFTLQLHFNCEISKIRFLQNFLRRGNLLGNNQVATWKFFRFPKSWHNGASDELKIAWIIQRFIMWVNKI